MVEIGSVIRAEVVRTEPYGIFLRFGGESVFVHLPEVSWLETGDMRERFRVGEAFDVLVVGYHYPKREIVGSIRRLQPGQNPYRALARLEPGTVLPAQVLNTWGNEVTCQLPNGARGYVPLQKLRSPVQSGDTLNTVIAALAVDEGRLWLEPVGSATEPSNPPFPPPGGPALQGTA